MIRKILSAIILVLMSCAGSYGEITKQTVETAFTRIAKADGFKAVPVNYENDSSPNAWVAFKSKDDYSIHVTTGLMKILNTEDEMAGVWGHEIGHVRLGHYTKGMLRNVGWNVAGKILERKTGKIAQTAGNIGMNLAENGFSRRQETQSDEYGVKLLVKAGYNPMGLYNAMKAFKDNGYGSQSGIVNWFSSHPATDDRLKNLAAFAEKYRKAR
ncbi:MAG: M48 family metallopeptidase [Synergistaceae bacterium]|nr:M48 family metallopeptidase [Synergistaceae bacterium]